MDFTTTETCASRRHCTFCRMSATWRSERDAPDVCPFGVTAESAIDAQSELLRRKPGLGDMVAAGLSAIGITKERVSRAVGGDCGCKKRQESLNALGRKIGIG